MKKCEYCNSLIDNSAKICPHCGADVSGISYKQPSYNYQGYDSEFESKLPKVSTFSVVAGLFFIISAALNFKSSVATGITCLMLGVSMLPVGYLIIPGFKNKTVRTVFRAVLIVIWIYSLNITN